MVLWIMKWSYNKHGWHDYKKMLSLQLMHMLRFVLGYKILILMSLLLQHASIGCGLIGGPCFQPLMYVLFKHYYNGNLPSEINF